jgi:flagellar motor switch protein FliG
MPAAAPATKSDSETPETPAYSRVQKLAALLVILGPEAASQILRGFETHEVEAISTEMAKFSMIDRELQHEILRDFSEIAVQAGTAIRGGVDVTRATLEQAIGVFKATEILSRVAPTRPAIACIHEIAEMEPRQIYNLIHHEQPQTIALLISYVAPEKAAASLEFFAAEQRDKILERVATLAPTPVEVVEKVVELLLARRGVSQTRALNQTGGVKTAADVLNSMDKAQGKTLLGTLEERNPELGQAIRQKMFTFEDLVNLDAPMLQRILREVDVRELALALKRNASEKLKAKLLGSISKRAAETVREEINFMGSVRLRDIESAQLRIIDAVRRLEAEGAVDLSEVRGEARNEMV